MPKDARFGLGFGIVLIVIIMAAFFRQPSPETSNVDNQPNNHSNVSPASAK